MQRHALATALLCAIALSACSTVSNEDEAARVRAIGSLMPVAPPPPAPPADMVAEAGVEAIGDARPRRGHRQHGSRPATSADAPAAMAYQPAPVDAGQAMAAGYWQPANTEKYAAHDDNPVHRASEQPVSTFSIDVDTGSYSNVRRMLREGVRPPADAVRAEEMINYFSYGHPAPASLRHAVPRHHRTGAGAVECASASC